MGKKTSKQIHDELQAEAEKREAEPETERTETPDGNKSVSIGGVTAKAGSRAWG